MNRITVLFVDDESSILKSYRRLLRKEDYDVLTAESGEAALEVLAENEIHVVVSDQQMPGMPGSQLLAHVRKLSPDIVRVTNSGYACAEAVAEILREGAIDRFLIKPWKTDELRLNLRQCVDQYRLAEAQRIRASEFGVSLELIERLRGVRDQAVADRIMADGDDVTCIRYLPYPSLMTDSNGCVVSIHESVARYWPRLAAIQVRQHVSTIGVESLTLPVQQALTTGAPDTIQIRGDCELPSAAHTVPLNVDGVEGCVVLLEPPEHSQSPMTAEDSVEEQSGRISVPTYSGMTT